VTAVLAVEREPEDREWVELCRSHGVVLTWPGQLGRIFEPARVGPACGSV